MFILGYDYIGGDNAISPTPTAVNNIDYISLTAGEYDDMYLTNATDFDLINDETGAVVVPTEWDYNTALYAQFNDDTTAGNVDWTLDNVSDLIIKSRPVGEFAWTTLTTKKVDSIEDFTINYNDYLAPSGAEMEYAVVTVLYGQEDNYEMATVKTEYSRMFLIEGDMVYSTTMTDGFCDTTRNIPSSNIELLNNKYPIFIRNTIANYDTGQCTGYFVPTKPDDDCDLAYDTEYNFYRISYQKEVMDFIADGNPKILKLPDGRAWLIQVTPSPTDTADGKYNDRQISFSWVEIGDLKDSQSLYLLGLSDVGPEWW